jgi:hypothetical protein
VLGIAIRFRIHRNGVDAQASAGADHAAGNLTAVGNQYALEHGYSCSRLMVVQSL